MKQGDGEERAAMVVARGRMRLGAGASAMAVMSGTAGSRAPRAWAASAESAEESASGEGALRRPRRRSLRGTEGSQCERRRSAWSWDSAAVQPADWRHCSRCWGRESGRVDSGMLSRQDLRVAWLPHGAVDDETSVWRHSSGLLAEARLADARNREARMVSRILIRFPGFVVAVFRVRRVSSGWC